MLSSDNTDSRLLPWEYFLTLMQFSFFLTVYQNYLLPQSNNLQNHCSGLEVLHCQGSFVDTGGLPFNILQFNLRFVKRLISIYPMYSHVSNQHSKDISQLNTERIARFVEDYMYLFKSVKMLVGWSEGMYTICYLCIFSGR